jgi:hypothetical protein
MALLFEPIFDIEADEIRDRDAEFLLQFAQFGQGFIAEPNGYAFTFFGFVCRFCQCFFTPSRSVAQLYTDCNSYLFDWMRFWNLSYSALR